MWADSIIFRPWLLLWLTLLTSVSLFIAESKIIFHYSSYCGFWNCSKCLCFIKMLFNIRNVEVFVFSNIDKLFDFLNMNLLAFLPCNLPLLILFLGYFLHINFLSTYWLNILTGMLYFNSTDELDHFRYLLFI